jgi:hypothetical protein
MGYGGKYVEQARARELRAQAWTLNEIAAELGVSKSSVSVQVRDVEFTPKPRNRGHGAHKPHPLQLRMEAEIARCKEEADAWAWRHVHEAACAGDDRGGIVAIRHSGVAQLAVATDC